MVAAIVREPPDEWRHDWPDHLMGQDSTDVISAAFKEYTDSSWQWTKDDWRGPSGRSSSAIAYERPKIPFGICMLTSMCGTSTVSEIFKSPANEQSTYASSRVSPCSATR